MFLVWKSQIIYVGEIKTSHIKFKYREKIYNNGSTLRWCSCIKVDVRYDFS